MVSDEHIDPVYSYIDGKIDSAVNDIKQTILVTQRQLAILKIVLTFNDCVPRINSLELNTANSLYQDLVADASAISSKIEASESPLSLSKTFSKKWYAELKKRGIRVFMLPT